MPSSDTSGLLSCALQRAQKATRQHNAASGFAQIAAIVQALPEELSGANYVPNDPAKFQKISGAAPSSAQQVQSLCRCRERIFACTSAHGRYALCCLSSKAFCCKLEAGQENHRPTLVRNALRTCACLAKLSRPSQCITLSIHVATLRYFGVMGVFTALRLRSCIVRGYLFTGR